MDDTIKLSFSKKAFQKKWESTKTFLSSTQGKALLTIILILIPLALSFSIRAQPAELTAFDRIGEQNVDQQLIQQFSQQIRQQNPALPSNSIEAQATQQLEEYKQQNPEEYRQQAEQISNIFKQEYQKPNGEPYLVAIDPYYYWRQTENVASHGHAADIINEDGERIDTYMLAPNGRTQSVSELHPHLSYFMYTVFGGLTGLSMYMMFFYMPAILASIATIPAYFIGTKFAGRAGGFLTALIVATHSAFVSRSVAGFSSTDGYNVAFPLFTFWFLYEAFATKELKKQLVWSGLAAIIIGLHAWAWNSWWLTYTLLITALVGNIIHTLARNAITTYKRDKNWSWKNLKDDGTDRNIALSIGVIIAGGIFASLTRGDGAYGFINSIIRRLQLDEAVGGDLWPNVFTTVAELGSQDFSGVVGAFGAEVFVLFGLIGSLFTVLPEKYKDDYAKKVYYWWFAISASVITIPFLAELTSEASIFLIALTYISGYIIRMFDDDKSSLVPALFMQAWIISLLVASTRGVRFNMILMPMIALGAAILVVKIIQWIRRTEISMTAKNASTLAVIVLVGLYVVPTVAEGYQAGERAPGMNDAWYNSLQTISEETNPDTIITSWWDFGHWFKQVADRPVTFDGATQNTPAAHWAGNLLQTSNEQQSTNTLRMLHCGNYEGYDHLLSATQGVEAGDATPAQHVQNKEYIDEALSLTERADAVAYYESLGLSSEEAESVADKTHCDVDESVVITSEDMVGKAPVWGHFGQWDFGKAYAVQTFDRRNPSETISRYAENIGISEEQAREYYLEVSNLGTERERQDWIAPRPQYITQRPTECDEENNTVQCDLDLTISQQRGQSVVLERLEVDVNSPEDAEFVLGIYGANNFRQQGERIPVDSLFMGDGETLEEYSGGNETSNIIQGIGFSALLHEENGNYELVMGDESLLPSMFTRLFFFDGAYTENYELLTEEQSQIAGTEVKVWTVET